MTNIKKLDALYLDIDDINNVAKLMKQGKSPEQIKESININDEVHVIFTSAKMDANHQAITKDFEFIYYSNHYYLLPEANMEDLALKLNVTKNELSIFLKDEIEENHNDMHSIGKDV